MTAAIRLNESHRNFLFDLAKTVARCPKEEDADAAAYKKAAPMVRALVEARYPVKDMKVLKKYGCAELRGKPKVTLTAGGIVEFAFREPDECPLAPADYDNRRAIYAASANETKAIEDCSTASAAYKKAREAKLNDYKALILASATLAEVEKVWPEASALRARVANTLPVVLSSDVIARISADVQTRAAA